MVCDIYLNKAIIEEKTTTKTGPKQHVSIYMTFWKKQNNSDRTDQGFPGMGMRGAQGSFLVGNRTVLDPYYNGGHMNVYMY